MADSQWPRMADSRWLTCVIRAMPLFPCCVLHWRLVCLFVLGRFPLLDEATANLDPLTEREVLEALRPLQQILEQKGWFGGGVKDEVRLAAACSLSLIGSPEAKAILQAGAGSREESVRRACLEAKRRFGI